jgi:hypothetical protein
MSSTSELVAKFGGFYSKVNKPNTRTIGGSIEYYTNPLEFIGGSFSNDELENAMESIKPTIGGSVREDNLAVIKVSVSSTNNDDQKTDNKNTKPFKSYLYNILDSVVV